jgi:hypothetical protein
MTQYLTAGSSMIPVGSPFSQWSYQTDYLVIEDAERPLQVWWRRNSGTSVVHRASWAWLRLLHTSATSDGDAMTISHHLVKNASPARSLELPFRATLR